nr:hypothetical protein [Tanacetum cinerariifolium]
MSDSKWSRLAGLKLARENLQSRVKEDDSITDVKNTVFDLCVMTPLSFLLVDERVFIGLITKFIKFIELKFSVITPSLNVKVFMLQGPVGFVLKLNRVVRAMMSPDGSIVASLENVNCFLAVYTPSDDLIRTNFEKKWVVLKVMLHILKEFVFLLGRHSLDYEVPRMNPTDQSRLRIFLSKEIFEGEMIHIHNAFVQDEDHTYGKVACIAHKLKGTTDGEAKINSIKNGDQPLPCVTQVSIAGTSSTEQPHLKDKSMWFDQEKRIQKIDHLARSLLIQGLLNDIYSLIDSNKTAKDLWDALARHMIGDVNDDMGSKKKTVMVTSDPLALIAKKMIVSKSKEKVVVSLDSEGNYKKVKVKDYEYYKTKMLLAKKDKDEQVLLAEDQAWMESSSDSDQEIKANMVFMAPIKKVLSDSEASSSSADEKISEVSYYLSKSESESEFETSEYYDNSTNYGLFVNNDDDQEIFHDAIESASENFIKNHIDSQKDYDKSDVDHNDFEEKDHLVDKLIRKFNKKIVKCQKRIEKANQQRKDFENQNKDLQDKYDVLKNQATTFEINNKELNEQLKELIEKNNDLLA